jgi:ABC-type glutathione transport system ATPase component
MSGLEVRDVTVAYGSVVAVVGASLSVERGASLGIVGESGSGKTTLAKAIVGIEPVRSGAILLDGTPLPQRRSVQQRQWVQMVHQDPYSSLNPRMTVRQTLSELLAVHRLVPRSGRDARCAELMTTVNLDPGALDAYPHQFSGGQRQRIAIARALAVEPRLLVADEPTSALDVSVQASIIALLRRLRADLGLTLVLISHDLAVVNALCDTIAVMNMGRLVEVAPRERFFRDPTHPYSRALLESVPRLSRRTT